jgi:signal transduction histidine kinase
MASEREQIFSPHEYQLLNRSIDEAIATAITSFEGTRSAEQRDRAEHLGFVVHEIRNAVGNASMAFELIRRGKAGTEGRTADVLHRALSRIANLVAESLAEARLMGAPAQREWMRLPDLFSQLLEDYPPQRGIRIQVDVSEDLCIDVDQRLLASALGNLLQNAFKFTRDNETIILRALSTNGTVAIEVEDRCGGLPTAEPDDLFRAFVQGTADRRGTGLGLAIARRAVEAHGGTLTVRNLSGIGCVFAILMPRTTVKPQ